MNCVTEGDHWCKQCQTTNVFGIQGEWHDNWHATIQVVCLDCHQVFWVDYLRKAAP